MAGWPLATPVALLDSRTRSAWPASTSSATRSARSASVTWRAVLGADVVEGDVGAAARRPRAAPRPRRRPCGRGRRRRRGRRAAPRRGRPRGRATASLAVPDGDRDAGGEGGAGGAAQQALVGRGHARAGRGGGHEPGGAAALDAGDHHALGDLLGEQVGELLGRPRRRRVGLRRQEVAAEQLLGALARGGDDVHAGGARQRLVAAARRGRGTCRCCRRSCRRRRRGSRSASRRGSRRSRRGRW